METVPLLEAVRSLHNALPKKRSGLFWPLLAEQEANPSFRATRPFTVHMPRYSNSLYKRLLCGFRGVAVGGDAPMIEALLVGLLTAKRSSSQEEQGPPYGGGLTYKYFRRSWRDSLIIAARTLHIGTLT